MTAITLVASKSGNANRMALNLQISVYYVTLFTYVVPMVCDSSQARDWTWAAVATCATAVATLGP